jgi:HAD superfamily hydrolase (TIGR01549 family)
VTKTITFGPEGQGNSEGVDKTVVFDVDGTLVDTNYHHTIAWFRAFQKQGVAVPCWRIHRAIGMGGDRLVPAVAGEDTDKVRADWKKIFDPMLPEIVPFDGARDLVTAAKERGFKAALASSGKPDHVKHYLQLLDLGDVADDWTSSEDVDATKPAPDLLHVALERVEGGNAVLIGDSVWDCKAAANAGIPCVALLTGGFSEGELREAGAVAVYESLPSLRDNLESLPFS